MNNSSQFWLEAKYKLLTEAKDGQFTPAKYNQDH
jgi:hypothetical protein